MTGMRARLRPGALGLLLLAASGTAVFAQSGGGGIGIDEPAACRITGSLDPVTVTPQALAAGGVLGSAGGVVIHCNTSEAAIFIGSDPMVATAARIAPADAAVFTREIDFAAYAQSPAGGDNGFDLASRPGVGGAPQSAWLSDVRPNARNVRLNVSAIALGRDARIPVAGAYQGQICLTVSPGGLPVPPRDQRTGRCTPGP